MTPVNSGLKIANNPDMVEKWMKQWIGFRFKLFSPLGRATAAAESNFREELESTTIHVRCQLVIY